MPPPSTRVTATLANAAGRRSISFEYQQTPIYHTPVTVEVPLDEKGCLAVELPFTEAQMASVNLDEEVKLFLEPGDQLHIDADLLDLPQSLRFSGQGAANNQFLAALRSRFPDYLRIGYKNLEVDTFRNMIDQRRLELESFLEEGCSQYQLTPAFIDYYRAEITYEWAKLVVSYPFNYMFANGNKNEGSRAVPADYHDALDQVELVDEAAIGTTHYRTFLGRNFLRLEMAAYEGIQLEQLSESQRQDLFETYTRYNQAKRLLHGKVLYFFLAGEIVRDFQHGHFDQGEQRLAEFLRDNPYPEYTEVVEEVVRETSKLKPGQPAPDFTLDDLQGQSVSLSDFKGQAVFLDFWASWCGPCIEDFPYLEQIKQQTRDQKVVFLSISLDSSADEWRQAVDEHGLTGVHVHAPDGRQVAVDQLYQVRGIPSYFLVGPDGRMDGHVGHVSDVEEEVSRIEKVASGQVPSSSPKSIRSEMVIRG